MENKEVQENQNKETVAFKCDPSLKTRLTNDAKQLGISLSEYTAGIISGYYNPEKPNEKPDTKIAIEPTAASQDIKTCLNNFEGKMKDILVQ